MTRPALTPTSLSVLSECAAEVAQAFVSLSSDIALVIDEQGVVVQVSQNASTPVLPSAEQWVGRPWAATVTGDTRRKIELMLSDLSLTGVARRREVNLAGEGGDIPVAFTALRLGDGGPVIATGRDLRTVAAIQQRFLDVQQDMERGYWRARQLESRYRLLFQVATDAVMTVEAQSLRIVEANHAAVSLFGTGKPLAGHVAPQLFDAASRPAMHGLLDSARSSGRPAEVHARLAAGGPAVAVTATPFRARDGMRLLLRIRTQDAATASHNDLNQALARLVDTTHDGVVVTDSGGRILVANPAFVAMVGAEREELLHGRPIADWVGRIAQDVPALIAGVHGHGIAQLVRTSLRRDGGQGAIEVDVSAALLTEGDQECFGFTLRACADVKRPTAHDERRTRLLKALAALEGQLGATSSHTLLERGRSLLEQYLAEAALARAAGEAAQAALMLGVTEDQLALLREGHANALPMGNPESGPEGDPEGPPATGRTPHARGG